jgi:hypothetical protein
MKTRLAMGHTQTLAPQANWDLPTLAGAGALRSTANDMLTFLAANLGYVKSPLAQAMADEISVRKEAGPNMEIAYNWLIQTKDGSSIIWHNGGTGGYRTYMGFDPKARTGVVVLTNISTPAGSDDIGRHLLNASYPLSNVAPPVERTATAFDPKSFDRYAGTYQLAPNTALTMSRDGDHLYTQLTGQGKIEMFAEGDRKFFLKVVDAQLTFDVDSQGAATQVTLHQNGRDQVARRLSASEVSALDARLADIARRFESQTQTAGTEDALRRSIREIQAGHPDYDLMTAEFADAARKQAEQMKTVVGGLGALQSVTFKGVGQGGMDIYEVVFEHGKYEWRISLAFDGKTSGLLYRKM